MEVAMSHGCTVDARKHTPPPETNAFSGLDTDSAAAAAPVRALTAPHTFAIPQHVRLTAPLLFHRPRH
jgi:hypothetical protein